jgi:hypothetical protein
VNEEAAVWQQRLVAKNKEIEEAQTGAGDGAQQQEFLDRFNFLSNDWRGGAKFQKAAPEAPEAPAGGVPLAELQNPRPFAGFKPGELPPPPGARIVQQAQPLPLEAGLREGAATQLYLEPGLAGLRVPERGVKLTFRRVEGHPELTVTLRSISSTWRYGAVIALLGVLSVFGLTLRRRRRRQ